ncbi:phosphotransferase family protein [Nocardia miyunensis]|uniref:phosphotransferase family protein n=1 Tax=Nocardia miyunensis TaxID=282684 RepID=UPI00082DBB97|nr:phosphotransferase family protein [Nocardia miyunensis]
MTANDLTWCADFDQRDNPSREFIAAIREQHPTEPEVDAMLTRKMQRRGNPSYSRPELGDLAKILEPFLENELGTSRFAISDLHWFTGGVSKIQIGFTLERQDGIAGDSRERLVLRMDPSEGSNATSRAREFELLTLMQGIVPVPEIRFLDADGEWFPEPALICEFVEGVTKPRSTRTGQISGLGTDFGPEYREKLAPQYLDHLARIHNTDVSGRSFEHLQVPRSGSTEAAEWAVHHALRCWEEDRGEDFPLMEVAANWLMNNMPQLDLPSVVHGDFRSGNFLFDEESGRIRAWLDWERGLIGDRHRDLAWITLPAMGHYGSDGRYLVCGLIPLDEFYARYSDASGLTVDPERMRFYQVLNCFTIIVSMMASTYRIARLGKSHQDILLTRVESLVPVISRQLVSLLRGENP